MAICNGFYSRIQNSALVTDVKVVLTAAMSDARQTGATQYHAQLGLLN